MKYAIKKIWKIFPKICPMVKFFGKYSFVHICYYSLSLLSAWIFQYIWRTTVILIVYYTRPLYLLFTTVWSLLIIHRLLRVHDARKHEGHHHRPYSHHGYHDSPIHTICLLFPSRFCPREHGRVTVLPHRHNNPTRYSLQNWWVNISVFCCYLVISSHILTRELKQLMQS